MTARGYFDTDRLETALARAGLSLDQLADRTGLDTRTLERIRAGKTQSPHPQTVATIARALAIADAGELWTWPGRSPAAAPGDGCAGATDQAPGPVNPFDPWTPAVPPAFVGRLDLLRTLERAAHEGLGLSLVGEPRIGKTSLLRTWRLAASGLGLKVCLVSGQGPEGAGERALVARVLADGRPDPVRAAATLLETVPEGADGAADRLADWCADGRGVPPARGQAGGRTAPRTRPILLIDEAETLLQRCRPRFLERLRGLLTDRRLSLALVTRRTLDAVYEDLGRTSPFPNLLGLERVGLLDADAARALIARGGDRWAPDDPGRLWAGAHPFYLALLARRLYDARGLGKPGERALERFRAEA